MTDEYDVVNANNVSTTWTLPKFDLENGIELYDVSVAYQTFGSLNERCDNVIIICHSLTTNTAVNEWWIGILERLDLQKHFVICSNILGSCYGTTGPMSVNTKTGKLYGTSFPDVTIRDSVNLQIKLVKEALGVTSV